MTRTGASANTLLNPLAALPPMEFVGPTVDDDIRRAIGRYGAEAVKAAVNRQTKTKVGRPKVNDWKELRSVIEEDAGIWLSGGDPFAARSNYSIAKTIADETPGQSHPATMKRLQRKLGARLGRKWFTLVSAWMKSEGAYPYAIHVRALRELCELDSHITWQWHLERAEGFIADYTAKHGDPANDLTMADVETGAKEPLNALLGIDLRPPRRGGMFGLLSQPREGAPAGLGSRYVKSAGE